tara:strand:+ start:94 stop:327 length:234 start_codon:yes stop_codon:yes gene_type:complete
MTIENNKLSEQMGVLPLGQKPEGEIDVYAKLRTVTKSLLDKIDTLEVQIKKLVEENKKLKDLVGVVETASTEGRELI